MHKIGRGGVELICYVTKQKNLKQKKKKKEIVENSFKEVYIYAKMVKESFFAVKQ